MNVVDLWLPILLTGLATHILSTIAWMILPHHKPEWKRLPLEDEFLGWMHKNSVPSGQYIFPYAGDGAEAQSDAFKQKQSKGTGMLTVWPTPTNMGKAIGFTFAYFMFAAFVIGYLSSIALPAGAPFMRVLQFTTTVGLVMFCAAHFPHAFWFRRKVAMELLDGCAFAFATGLIFASLWPSAHS